MTAVPGRSSALAYLRGVAVSDDPTAPSAINVLISDAQGGNAFGARPTVAEQGQSRAILEDLLKEQALRNRTAARALREWLWLRIRDVGHYPRPHVITTEATIGLSRWVLVAVVMLVATCTLRAQPAQENPTVAQAASVLRSHGCYTEAVCVLTHVHGSQSREKMDAVADSLVAMAVGSPGNDPRAANARIAAPRPGYGPNEATYAARFTISSSVNRSTTGFIAIAFFPSRVPLLKS